MSLIKNPRVECGKILQNCTGQYFFVCSTCELEFVTLSSFLSHQNDGHEADELRNQSNDLTIPFLEQTDEITVDTDTSDSADDCSEPVEKIRAGLGTSSQCEPRLTRLVSPKPRKTARKIGFAPSFDKYKCKNCRATFSTMVNLDYHEVVCMMLPVGFYSD
ncbi:uncharacterized protein LOC119083459 [Bradysia coprophila]|uniref:uncharacterized protein LOC119083459 n=1 Tax=Bradysia coprophila TaxID=38358 RepID=UPI00187D78B3|nr:uncharacterized protein LOC119083459 [Bradysia coprophila]